VTKDEAWKFAEHWVAAWNAHDLELIMTHYEDAIELTSPIAAQLLGTPSGKLNFALERGRHGTETASRSCTAVSFRFSDSAIRFDANAANTYAPNSAPKPFQIFVHSTWPAISFER
jgi:hypothetical protein